MGDEAVKPWVSMKHPDVESTASASRAAFEALWADKGWQIVDEHDTPPDHSGDAVLPERHIAADGVTITDTPVDPQRLTKVLAGELKPEDVGVDPAVLDAPVAAESPEPVDDETPAEFVVHAEGESYEQYAARAVNAGVKALKVAAWEAVAPAPAGTGA